MIQNASYWENRPLDDIKRDWNEQGENWIKDYALSINHPHRQLIINALQTFETSKSLLEIGCNAGPNLKMISQIYPEIKLGGIDVNQQAINEARKFIPEAELRIGNVLKIPFPDESFDVVLADAVLMYIDSSNIMQAMNEINRVAKQGMIFIEWNDFNEKGVLKDFHWARNYGNILLKYGYDCVIYKINQKQWPSKVWIKNGYLYVGLRQVSLISEPKFWNDMGCGNGIGGETEVNE